ncbi:hypothetical protein QYE76_068267 [Lolium multiflorum]|uniref:Uncharacterized protein n=1 Tax=Lolium multiflorum TaxID=4521 RepID=A0AAD8WDT4_LOLMU|nr:hypothetical protein QYE76_068267 [Lolium multiflorum]
MENYSLFMGAAAVMKMAVEMAAVSMEKPSGALPGRMQGLYIGEEAAQEGQRGDETIGWRGQGLGRATMSSGPTSPLRGDEEEPAANVTAPMSTSHTLALSETHRTTEETSTPHQDLQRSTPATSPRASSPKRARIELGGEFNIAGSSTTPPLDDPLMKHFINLGTQFIGYRDTVNRLKEDLVVANKRADDLAVKLEKSEEARKKAEKDATSIEDLRKRLHEAETALSDKITQQIAREENVTARLESQSRRFVRLLERDIFDLFLPEFDKPWVIHLRETCLFYKPALGGPTLSTRIEAPVDIKHFSGAVAGRKDKTLLDTTCSGSFTSNKEEFKRDLLDRIKENAEDWENDKGYADKPPFKPLPPKEGNEEKEEKKKKKKKERRRRRRRRIKRKSAIHASSYNDIESSKLGEEVFENPFATGHYVLDTSPSNNNDGLLERDIFDLFLPEFDKPWTEQPGTFAALAKSFVPKEDLGLALRQENLKIGVEGTIALVAESQQSVDWAKVGAATKLKTVKWQTLIGAAKPYSKKILAFLGYKPAPSSSSAKMELMFDNYTATPRPSDALVASSYSKKASVDDFTEDSSNANLSLELSDLWQQLQSIKKQSIMIMDRFRKSPEREKVALQEAKEALALRDTAVAEAAQAVSREEYMLDLLTDASLDMAGSFLDAAAEDQRVETRSNLLVKLALENNSSFWSNPDRTRQIARFQDRVGQPKLLPELMNKFKNSQQIHDFVKAQLIAVARFALIMLQIYHSKLEMTKVVETVHTKLKRRRRGVDKIDEIVTPVAKEMIDDLLRMDADFFVDGRYADFMGASAEEDRVNIDDLIGQD